MLATVSALSMWAFVGFVQQARKNPPGENRALYQWAWAFALFNVIGEYTHFSYALLMLAQGILAVFLLLELAIAAVEARMPRSIAIRALMVYSGVNLVTIALFTPWLMTAISQVNAQPNVSAIIPLGELAITLQGWLAFGRTYAESLGGMGVVIYFLLIFGLIRSPSQRRGQAWALLVPVIWVLVAVGLYLYLDLYTRYLRFLLPAQIAVALWMGRGVWVIWHLVPRSAEENRAHFTRHIPKLAAVVALGAYCFTLFQGLVPLYTDPAYFRDDYRHLAQIIKAEEKRGDAIILSAPGLQEIFGYYYDGDLPIYPLPAGADILGDTRAVIAEHNRIFAVLYGVGEQDPQGIVTRTLNQEAYQMNAEWVDNIRLERYASPAVFDTVQASGAAFGEHIRLQSYALSDTHVRPNDALQIQLEWTTDALLNTRYKVFIQLLNSAGNLVAQRDSEPAGGEALTTLWQPGQIILDNHALAIPGDLSAGEYTLIIGLYDENPPQERLPVGDADYLILGIVQLD